MIVPMKKIMLVVLDRERETALATLRKLGVMHVERRESSSLELSELQSFLSKLDQAIAFLSDVHKKTGAVLPGVGSFDRTVAVQSVDRVLALRDERRSAIELAVHIDRELDRLSPWGDIHPADFAFLRGRGIDLVPVEIPLDEFDKVDPAVRVIVVSRTNKMVRCLVFRDNASLPRLTPRSFELGLPSKSSAAMRADRDACLACIPALSDEMLAETAFLPALLTLKERVIGEIQFEAIRAEMPLVGLGPEGAPSQHDVAWLSGFIPAEDEHALQAAAKTHGWAFIADDPAETDTVPTKIRNNRFVSLVSPLLDFLGTVPGYREIDISLWFLLFFGIFFAMIFGDGGYGSIMVILSTFAIVRSIIKKKDVATGLYLFLYLGIMTVAWGTITCTWFGMPVEYLPAFFRSLAIPAFSNGNPDSAENIKVFCFTLGLLQLSIAHIIGIVRNIKTAKFLGELGSLLMVGGMFFVVLNLVVNAEKYPLSNLIVYMIGAGFVLNFVFINYAGHVCAGILESLKNIISMCLGVVNVFADVMSYIRLWAVGLAGAAISSTINTMAGPMFGSFIIFAGVLLLVFGHGFNFILNVLSVIVHGVRLNTLEFSNHLGLTWSGFKYEPFSETVKK